MNKAPLSLATVVLGVSLATGHALGTSTQVGKLTSRPITGVPLAMLHLQQWQGLAEPTLAGTARPINRPIQAAAIVAT